MCIEGTYEWVIAALIIVFCVLTVANSVLTMVSWSLNRKILHEQRVANALEAENLNIKIRQ